MVVVSLALLASVPYATAESRFTIRIGVGKSKMDADKMNVEMGPLADLDALWQNPSPPDEQDVLLLERAKDGFKPNKSQCAFTLWETEDGQSWSEHRFEPHAMSQWRLLSTSDVQVHQVDSDKEGYQEPALRQHPTVGILDDLDEFSQDGALSVLLEETDLTVFGLVSSFNEEGERDSASKRFRKKKTIKIAIVVSHDPPMIKAADSMLAKPFSPKFGLRITYWRVTEIYEYNKTIDSMAAAHRSMAIRGRLFRLAPFQQNMMQWYDDFTC